MKGQGTRLSRRLSEYMNISGEVVAVAPSHSHSLEEAQNNAHPNYVQLRDVSKKRKSHLTAALDILTALGISEEALSIGQPLKALLAKEMSCSRYFRWAAVDNLAEKILQGLVLNKQDASQEEIKFCTGMIRQVPSGRSLLLYQACGLRKVYAARGLVLTTEMVLNQAVKAFIYVSLSYRLYEWLTTGTSNFSDFETIFASNSKKGVSSLVRLLANFDSEWLYLLLTSPAIAGLLKGLWDTQKSQPLTQDAITQLQEAVNYHTNLRLKKSYLWGDVFRQMIPMPGFSSVSERIQRAEQQIRWDGRITNGERASLFSNIERLALQGSGMSKINAMQSLAKIVHSFSIKDFHRLQDAGYPQETLVQILRIKTQALYDLKMLSNCVHLQPEEAQQSPTAVLQKSLISTLYATYLLWWLGMGDFNKYLLLFWSFKLGKLGLETLFLKVVVESILEVINCPDKKGFRMFFGDYAIWANQLTPDCFNEFVRQFRFISKEEPFQPFLDQLNNFDLRVVESIDLSNKALTSNETRDILNVLNKRASIKVLNLALNKINETMELSFPNSLQSLDLSVNNIGGEGAKGLNLPTVLQFLNLSYSLIDTKGAKGLNLPARLQSLDLSLNSIGDEGAKVLQLPASLTDLDLSVNNIGDEGAQRLQFPSMLRNLNLSKNNIGAEGAKGLQLPSMLTFLDLYQNNMGAAGVSGLQLPPSLKSLSLGNNNIGAEGAKELQLPSTLQSLDLSLNSIGDEGAKMLQLPASLTDLDLTDNDIGAEGAKGLQLPLLLQSLDLNYNFNMGAEGAKGLQLPPMLQFLDLSSNDIGAEGAKGLQLPPSLQSLNLYNNNIRTGGAKWLQLPPSLTFLSLAQNNIGTEGAKRLQLPSMLQSLNLYYNGIGAEGVKGLQLPPSLRSLNLYYNNISSEGAKWLQLPPSLQSLVLVGNSIGDEGAKMLQLPASLTDLDLSSNDISAEGAKGLQLPASLTDLDLSSNDISAEGAKGLQLPPSLQSLVLGGNNIGDEGAKELQLPAMLHSLILWGNNIGDEGINALLKKIPKTNLTIINLYGNPYNSTAISPNVTIQQQILLRNCQDKLCHVNTPLWQQDESQTSSATRMQPPLFFGWLKKPFDKLSEYASDCMSTTLDSLGARLQKVLSQSPAYFPNIHSPEINDWQPSGSVMLNQFNGASNTLLLSAAQTTTQPSLRAIAR